MKEKARCIYALSALLLMGLPVCFVCLFRYIDFWAIVVAAALFFAAGGAAHLAVKMSAGR